MTWPLDVSAMHVKFGHSDAVEKFDPGTLAELYTFRLRFLNEELVELQSAKGPEDVVDALIDLCVVAIGTLDLFQVDAQEAWRRVTEKNMQKESGRNSKRPGSAALPDLIKPPGWEPPDHTDNVGKLREVFDHLRRMTNAKN